MTTSSFRSVAAEVQKAMAGRPRTEFARVASEVQNALGVRLAAQDRDAEWQRVNSYVADVLKDSHVLYAKLARLQGDFSGEELARLSKISESVLMIGDELSQFSKAFYEGKYEMLQNEFTYGKGGGAPIPNPAAQEPEAAEAGAGGAPAESYDVEAPAEEAPAEGGGEKAPAPDGEEGGEEEAPLPEEDEEEAPDYEAPEEQEQAAQ